MENYKEKIRKLLALSKSDNENEAKAALLKARALMAEHKLTEAELADVPEKEVQKIFAGPTCTKRTDWWMVSLAVVIAENYCCQSFTERGYGRKTYAIGFIGLDGDVECCVEIFCYAVDCIQSGGKIERKKYRKEHGTEYVNYMYDSYCYGYVA